jgi:hypothetical protein
MDVELGSQALLRTRDDEWKDIPGVRRVPRERTRSASLAALEAPYGHLAHRSPNWQRPPIRRPLKHFACETTQAPGLNTGSTPWYPEPERPVRDFNRRGVPELGIP